ncbi:MAG: cell division protein FtsL [Deltaproteobacteria bacterium]|nr:cell division protein FtsL [Deltaproteobacteria bacterium]
MTRLNLLLLVVLVCSAIYLVQTSYESRRLYAALERERNAAHQLDVEAEGLDVARRAHATSLRVERVAREELRMRAATPAVTEYVTDPARTAAAAQGGRP